MKVLIQHISHISFRRDWIFVYELRYLTLDGMLIALKVITTGQFCGWLGYLILYLKLNPLVRSPTSAIAGENSSMLTVSAIQYYVFLQSLAKAASRCQ